MKQINSWMYFLITFACAAVLSACAGDGIEESSFESKVYLNSEKEETLLIKPGEPSYTKTLQTALPKALDHDITVRFAADLSKVDEYNTVYKDNALPLPEAQYKFTTSEAIIPAGTVRSTQAVIDFVDVDKLDREKRYVLPVRIVDAGDCTILARSATTHYIFKGAALINVVANMERNYCKVNWQSNVSAMSELTFEALVRAKSFTNPESSNDILSLMGIEGYFLLRTGDTLYPGQLMLSTGTNFPGKDATKVLPANEWIHIALTFSSGNVIIYINGKPQSEGSITRKSINLKSSGSADDSNMKGFLIGASWDKSRWWVGEMCEMRVWETARTQEEIASNFYYVDPHSEGLVAYWKFDDGEGSKVTDRTGHGNDAVALNEITWIPVELPAK